MGISDVVKKGITKLGGKSTSGTADEAALRQSLGKSRAKKIAGAGAAGTAGAAYLLSGEDQDGSKPEKKAKTRSTLNLGEDDSVSDRLQVERGDRMAKAASKSIASKSPARKSKDVGKVYESTTKQRSDEPVSDAGHITYDGDQTDIHPETASINYGSGQTPFSDRPIDEAATSLNRMGKYAKGGGIGRGMGAATRGGGCVMKRAGGGKVMSRGVAKRGFGKEIR